MMCSGSFPPWRENSNARRTASSHTPPTMTNGIHHSGPVQALHASGDLLYHEEYIPPFLPALVLLPFLLPLFWRYRVTVSRDQVVFGYSTGLTRKCIDRSMILSATPIPHVNGLLEWGGWGIRMKLRGNEVGYICRNGPAVCIQTTGTETKYTFNCKDPQLVCDILMPRRKSSDKFPSIS